MRPGIRGTGLDSQGLFSSLDRESNPAFPDIFLRQPRANPRRNPAPPAVLGNIDKIPYYLWAPGVEVKSLVDSTHTPTRGLHLGAARITTELARHQHLDSELYLITSGRGRMEVGNKTHALEAGMFVYLPPGITHFTAASEEPLEFTFLFPTDSLEAVEYVFDGSLREPSTEAIVGRFSGPSRDERWTRLFRAQETQAPGLGLDRLELRSDEAERITPSDAPRILLVEGGSGQTRIGDQIYNVTGGSYLFMPPQALVGIQAGQEQLSALLLATA